MSMNPPSSFAQVQILNDKQTSRFETHPVYSVYQAGAKGMPQLSYVARNSQPQNFEGSGTQKDHQQLQSSNQKSGDFAAKNQNSGKRGGKQKNQQKQKSMNYNNNNFMPSPPSTFPMSPYQLHNPRPGQPGNQFSSQSSAQILRLNNQTMQGAPQYYEQYPQVGLVQTQSNMQCTDLTSSQIPNTSIQAVPCLVKNFPSATGYPSQHQLNSNMQRFTPNLQTREFHFSDVPGPQYPMPISGTFDSNQVHKYNWDGYSQGFFQKAVNHTPVNHTSSIQSLKVLSTPLRVKTHALGQPKTQASPLLVSATSNLEITQQAKQESSQYKIPESMNKQSVLSDREFEIDQIADDLQDSISEADNKQVVNESAQSAHKPESPHLETFACVSQCTKWYLLAQIGNSQIRIPAKNLAVRFSDNPQELPILTKDMDLLENLVIKEEALSTSDKPITQLNRAVNAGNNPSSSNNLSNRGYRKKEHVVAAQREYERSLQLNLVGDQDHEKQKKYPLYLPISNNAHDTNTRIVDLYLHHRTQQLMCLEFDLTHLKIDDTESSFSGEYSDNLLINPTGDEMQPTPFMGMQKNQGVSSFGQPSHVLYINHENNVARQLRMITQEYVEQTTYFQLNGECHGKRVFEQDLKYQIQGKKVIKSIQERLIRAKDYFFNEIIRLDPGVTHRNHHSNSSASSSSKSREPVDRKANKTQQRSQKQILGTLRSLNKRNKGPFLRRPDQIHIPIVNVTKSLGFKLLMPNLASIDNMLTNFNQIVMQEGLIQSFFFTFDLPVHQLSTSSPAISNSLVVKVPREMTQGGAQTQSQQAAYLAYHQHQAAMMQAQHQMMYMQYPQPIAEYQPSAGEMDSTKTGEISAIQQIGNPLWNLVDEFKKISQPPSGIPDQKIDSTKGPFPYRGMIDQHSGFSPGFSQQIASPSQSNSSSTNHLHPQFLSQISSLLSHGGTFSGTQNQKQFSCGSSSHNSNLSQNNFGIFPSPPNHMMPMGSSLSNPHCPPQKLHQALYTLSNQFQFGFGASHSDQAVLKQGISYMPPTFVAYIPPTDPNYLCNLDRLLEAITPKVSLKQLESTSVKDFFKAFYKASVFGLRVELLNEQTLESELYTFTPTLSSLILSYTKPMVSSDGEKLNRILDFDGIQEIKSLAAENQKLQNVPVQSVDFEKGEHPPRDEKSSSASEQQPSKPQFKFIEHHESEPYYQRPAFFSKIKEIIADLPHLKHLMLKQPGFNFDTSWFSILWTCQRVCTVPSNKEEISQLELACQSSLSAADNAKMSSAAVTNIQFLAIFRFRPDPSQLPGPQETAYNRRLGNGRRLPVQLIGLMPYKLERESFWVSPSHLQTDNNLQGEMYDQICEDNIILLQDLQQRAIEFLQPQSRREDMHDFTNLLNSTNSSIFDNY